MVAIISAVVSAEDISAFLRGYTFQVWKLKALAIQLAVHDCIQFGRLPLPLEVSHPFYMLESHPSMTSLTQYERFPGWFIQDFHPYIFHMLVGLSRRYSCKVVSFSVVHSWDLANIEEFEPSQQRLQITGIPLLETPL